MCDQQSLRTACAYAQSDQSLCLSLEYSRTVKLLIEHHLEFLSLKGGCTDSSESTLVKKPHCWKSHVVARMFWVLKRNASTDDIIISIINITSESLKARKVYRFQHFKSSYKQLKFHAQ